MSIGQEKVAYVCPAETTYRVSVRDGTGLREGYFVERSRNYYESIEKACEAAQRRVKNDKADNIEYSPVVERELE